MVRIQSSRPFEKEVIRLPFFITLQYQTYIRINRLPVFSIKYFQIELKQVLILDHSDLFLYKKSTRYKNMEKALYKQVRLSSLYAHRVDTVASILPPLL